MYGSAVIEFEVSPKQTLSEAERPLREYVAAIWQPEPTLRRNLDAVATYGIPRKIHLAVLPVGSEEKIR